MTIQELEARVEYLQQEHQKVSQQISMLEEQIVKSKNHIHMLMGHLNEAHYQKAELMKKQAEPKPEESNECVDSQEAEQPAE